ncbi:MAG TPA: hypothetical protein VN673_12015 [Clostridia bacterium]|nr:hypothetical protein [Clostridia bacterium]
MRTRPLLVITLARIALVAIVALAASACWERKQTPFQNAPKLLSALQAFSRDQGAAGRQLPPEIPVETLLQGGYLTTNDVSGFVGMDLTFSTQAGESNPQTILAHARTRDGRHLCLLADGSVQQLSQRRYEEQRATLGQTGAANGSQPFSLETNQMSGAAGSPR